MSGELPEEINVSEEFQIGEDGRQFLYEKDGVKYGGDFLSETPDMISLENGEFPEPPEEINSVL